MDGYLRYEKEKYDSVKSELQQLNPDVTDVTIKKEVQRRWDVLSYNEQKNWDSKNRY